MSTKNKTRSFFLSRLLLRFIFGDSLNILLSPAARSQDTAEKKAAAEVEYLYRESNIDPDVVKSETEKAAAKAGVSADRVAALANTQAQGPQSYGYSPGKAYSSNVIYSPEKGGYVPDPEAGRTYQAQIDEITIIGSKAFLERMQREAAKSAASQERQEEDAGYMAAKLGIAELKENASEPFRMLAQQRRAEQEFKAGKSAYSQREIEYTTAGGYGKLKVKFESKPTVFESEKEKDIPIQISQENATALHNFYENVPGVTMSGLGDKINLSQYVPKSYSTIEAARPYPPGMITREIEIITEAEGKKLAESKTAFKEFKQTLEITPKIGYAYEREGNLLAAASLVFVGKTAQTLYDLSIFGIGESIITRGVLGTLEAYNPGNIITAVKEDTLLTATTPEIRAAEATGLVLGFTISYKSQGAFKEAYQSYRKYQFNRDLNQWYDSLPKEYYQQYDEIIIRPDVLRDTATFSETNKAPSFPIAERGGTKAILDTKQMQLTPKDYDIVKDYGDSLPEAEPPIGKIVKTGITESGTEIVLDYKLPTEAVQDTLGTKIIEQEIVYTESGEPVVKSSSSSIIPKYGTIDDTSFSVKVDYLNEQLSYSNVPKKPTTEFWESPTPSSQTRLKDSLSITLKMDGVEVQKISKPQWLYPTKSASTILKKFRITEEPIIPSLIFSDVTGIYGTLKTGFDFWESARESPELPHIIEEPRVTPQQNTITKLRRPFLYKFEDFDDLRHQIAPIQVIFNPPEILRDTAIKEDTRQILAPIAKNKVINDIWENSIYYYDLASTPAQLIESINAQDTKLEIPPLTIQEQITEQITEFNDNTQKKNEWPPEPEEPDNPIFFRFQQKENSSLKQKVELYNVSAKEQGKFIKLNKEPLPYNKALNLGGEVVDNTSSATFRVTKANKRGEAIDDTFFKKSSKFRQNKGEYIELNNFRIDTEGELQGITVKGWKAKRNNRRWF